MGNIIIHLFFPHETNNLRPRAIHSSALIFYVILFLLFQISGRVVKFVNPQILGFATDINIEKLLNLTNFQRAQNGLPPLRLDPKLCQAASLKAEDMFSKNYWAHNAPDGTTPWVFITRAGYQYIFAGENLARDFSNSEGVVSAWMASPSHRDNILKKEYQDIGFAVVNGKLNGEETTLVVQLFGTPKPSTLVNKPVVIPQRAATIASPLPSPTSISLPMSQEESFIKEEKLLIPPTTLSSLNEIEVSHKPLISFFALTKNFAILIVLGLLAVLTIDGVIIWRRKIFRFSGHNLAHIIFLLSLLSVLWLTNQGVIL